VIVTPDTVLRWRRRRFRLYWTKLSGQPTGGRPPVSPEIRALVRRIAEANPLWGAPRIHGELLKLGIDVAERTVYHGARTHLSLQKDAPDGRPIERAEVGRVVALPEIGGLHHRYVRQAA
jgi:Homeodomain-like domain